MTKKIILLSTLFFLGLSTYSDNTPCNLTDKGVVINGIRWATRNVDAPGTFAETPESFGMFFQWNRRKGWSMSYEQRVEGWDRSIPEGTKWYAENNPCPEGWRVPTIEEINSLVDAGSEWINQNDVNGRLFGTAPYQIFLPAVGFRGFDNNFHHQAGSRGWYWSSSPIRGRFFINNHALALCFYRRPVRAGNRGGSWRANALSIRCVAK